jgi:ATP-binding cassette, subfamily B, bacterial
MTLSFLMSLIRPYRAGLLLLTAILLAEAAISLVIPWIGGQLGAAFLGPERQGAALGLAAGILGLLFLLAMLRMVSAIFYARVSESILADLRLRLFDHLLALPLPWHQARNRGDVMAIMTLEIERLGHFVTGTLVALLPMVLTAAGATLLMLRIDPVLSFLVPVLVPAFYVMVRLLGRLLRGLAQRIQAEHATAVSMVEEMLDLLPAIKSFTVEPVERARFATQVETLRRLSLERGLDPCSPRSCDAVRGGGLCGGAPLPGRAEPAGGPAYARRDDQFPDVCGPPRSARVQSRLGLWPDPDCTGHPGATAGRFLRRAGADGPAGAPLPGLEGDIRFDGVTFSYPDRGTAVRDLELHIRPGEKVALTGPNGAGKTTAVGLLLGFFRPQRGRILLDGQDIADLPPDHLRAAIGYVPQTRHLRNASVAENIAFGMPGFVQADIEAAARIAQAHAFIQDLPQGYDTLIGDKGVRLSGGQQQRVALARALLKDPAVLILDEATSMYDLEGEAAFLSDCRRRSRGAR